MSEHLTVVIAIPPNYTMKETKNAVDHALHRALAGDYEWVFTEGVELPSETPEPFTEDNDGQ